MIADVPVGAMLSGGIDSSLLVSLLAKELGVRVETFTVSFDDRGYDESAYAQLVAKHLGLVHRKIPVPSNSIADLDEIHVVLDQFDQPFVDSSAIPTHLLCRELRKHVKVAIGGDGGDETFGGYPRIYQADFARRLGQCPPRCWRRPDRSAGRSAISRPSRLGKSARSSARPSIAGNSGFSIWSAMPIWIDCRQYLTSNACGRLEGYCPRVLADERDGYPADGRDMIDVTMNFSLPGDYLRKVDVMSMAHGLEVRVPFLGKRVLELAEKIPHRLKHPARNRSKMLLRSLLRQYLPDEISSRGKSGLRHSSGHESGPDEAASHWGDAHRSRRPHPGPDRPRHHADVHGRFVTGRRPEPRWSRTVIYQNVYMLWSLERWLQKWDPST